MLAPASHCRHCTAVRCIATISYRKVIVIRETTKLSIRPAVSNRDQSQIAWIIPINFTIHIYIYIIIRENARVASNSIYGWYFTLTSECHTANANINVNKSMRRINISREIERERKRQQHLLHIYLQPGTNEQYYYKRAHHNYKALSRSASISIGELPRSRLRYNRRKLARDASFQIIIIKKKPMKIIWKYFSYIESEITD